MLQKLPVRYASGLRGIGSGGRSRGRPILSVRVQLDNDDKLWAGGSRTSFRCGRRKLSRPLTGALRRQACRKARVEPHHRRFRALMRRLGRAAGGAEWPRKTHVLLRGSRIAAPGLTEGHADQRLICKLVSLAGFVRLARMIATSPPPPDVSMTFKEDIRLLTGQRAFSSSIQRHGGIGLSSGQVARTTVSPTPITPDRSASELPRSHLGRAPRPGRRALEVVEGGARASPPVDQDHWPVIRPYLSSFANRSSISPIWIARMQISTSFPSSAASLG